MRKNQLQQGNEIAKQIKRLETEHTQFRENMGYNTKIPDTINISGSFVYAQTKITDSILIQVSLKEVDNRFIEKLTILNDKFKNL